MPDSPDVEIARLTERDNSLSDRLDKIESSLVRFEGKIDNLTEKLGDQKVTVAKWSGTISLLVSGAGAFVLQAVM